MPGTSHTGTSPLGAHPADPPAPSAAVLDWGLFLRQVQGVMRLEIRRQFFARRVFVPLALAFAPVALAAIWSVSPLPEKMGTGPMVITPLFATFFRGYLSTSLFLSSLILFSGLFRNEILEKSLHYYYLTPVRREVIMAGKFVSALIGLAVIFAAGTGVFYLVMVSPWGLEEAGRFLFQGPGLGHLTSYLGIAVLGCLGYGAVFLLVGQSVRNPIVPGLLLWGWEWANIFLPALLKKISVIFYLSSMFPIQPAGGAFAILADPFPPWLAVVGLIVFTGLVLVITGWRAQRMEITYGGDD